VRGSWFRIVLLLSLSLLLCAGASGEVLDKIFLNSTVLISYPVTAPRTATANTPAPSPSQQILGVMNGTGFLLFSDVGISKARVYLITNRHVLPPEGEKKDIQLRVVVRQNDGAAKIEEISVPVVGSDGKYLPTVSVHSDPSTDVAAFGIRLQVQSAG